MAGRGIGHSRKRGHRSPRSPSRESPDPLAAAIPALAIGRSMANMLRAAVDPRGSMRPPASPAASTAGESCALGTPDPADRFPSVSVLVSGSLLPRDTKGLIPIWPLLWRSPLSDLAWPTIWVAPSVAVRSCLVPIALDPFRLLLCLSIWENKIDSLLPSRGWLP